MVESDYYSQMVSANSCSHVHLDDFDSEHYVCVDCGCLIARPRLHREDEFCEYDGVRDSSLEPDV